MVSQLVLPETCCSLAEVTGEKSPLFLCGWWPPSQGLGRKQTLLPKAAVSVQRGSLCIQGELQDDLLLIKHYLGLGSAWDSPSRSTVFMKVQFDYFV